MSERNLWGIVQVRLIVSSSPKVPEDLYADPHQTGFDR